MPACGSLAHSMVLWSRSNDQLHTVLYCVTSLSWLHLHTAPFFMVYIHKIYPSASSVLWATFCYIEFIANSKPVNYRIPGNISGQKNWRFYSKLCFKQYWRKFNLAVNPGVTHVRYVTIVRTMLEYFILVIPISIAKSPKFK